jgi:hypothetical protein
MFTTLIFQLSIKKRLFSLLSGRADSQITGVAGCIALLKGLAITRGSEVFQNIPGKKKEKRSTMRTKERRQIVLLKGMVMTHGAVRSLRTFQVREEKE